MDKTYVIRKKKLEVTTWNMNENGQLQIGGKKKVLIG